MRLSEIPGAREHEWYGEWIRMYESDEFGAVAQWQIQWLFHLTALGLYLIRLILHVLKSVLLFYFAPSVVNNIPIFWPI